ncbi:DUF5319 domain-containing protein [Corynebacterium heidelbergense]|uniref:DUF5319 domain-containing protein n=1 Tax=Corynebacterium heidelbergense TaxID=2055947 RepID=A0A364V652_9CORY|nr:DUF5319 domain-containing protein [Corynebacterium heidelbergense]RAV32130.1 hypothetical protein DLJ54_04765 [Corynebacterium heidelbergense]RAV33886.1 hypothetical protein CWC39_06120 [Corynebacterium heidelbergense]WCZ37274.1 hypothetical protein CHEID_08720 [Corynebacterium heidelbergense]
MPPDPFANDPNDPASFLEPDEEFVPPTPEEIVALHEDLSNVRLFRSLLEPRGIRGIGMVCEDCEELHFYDWEIMEYNITSLLNNQAIPVHEPGAKTNPDHYVSWDYCLGYADAAGAMETRRWL